MSFSTLSKSSEMGNSDRRVSHRMGVLTVCMLGIGRIVAARCKYWNEGLKVGQNNFLVFAIIECVGTVLFGSCLAEMAGALPFTGGAYGYARGIYGPYLGFMVGVLEIISNVSGLSSLVVAFAQSCVLGLDVSIAYFPLFFLVLFFLTSLVQLLRSHQYVAIMWSLTAFSLLLTLVYSIGSITQLDYYKYAYNSDIPRTTIVDIISYAPIPTYFFTGLEMLPILGHFAREPRKAISYAIWATIGFGVVAMITTIVLASGQSPGVEVLQSASLPLNYGFANMFGMSSQAANLFNLPLLSASFMIGEYFLCIILRSMAESGLLFAHIKLFSMDHNKPFTWRAMLFSYFLMILCSAALFIVLYFGFRYVMNFCYFMTLCFYALYFCLFLTYISFSQRFPLIPRYFVSPFGVTGAYLGVILYGFLAVMIVVYPNGGIMFAIWVVIMAALTYFYLVRVRPHEKFSGEEERVFFIAYVIKSNYNSRQRIANRASINKRRKSVYSFQERLGLRFDGGDQNSLYNQLWRPSSSSHSHTREINNASDSYSLNKNRLHEKGKMLTTEAQNHGDELSMSVVKKTKDLESSMELQDLRYKTPRNSDEISTTAVIHGDVDSYLIDRKIDALIKIKEHVAVDGAMITATTAGGTYATLPALTPSSNTLQLSFDDVLSSKNNGIQLQYLQQFETTASTNPGSPIVPTNTANNNMNNNNSRTGGLAGGGGVRGGSGGYNRSQVVPLTLLPTTASNVTLSESSGVVTPPSTAIASGNTRRSQQLQQQQQQQQQQYQCQDLNSLEDGNSSGSLSDGGNHILVTVAAGMSNGSRLAAVNRNALDSFPRDDGIRSNSSSLQEGKDWILEDT